MATTPLFVYGSLMHPKILMGVLGRSDLLGLDIAPAWLKGFHRYKVENVAYPAVLATDKSATVDGLLVRGLTDAEMRALDEFEGSSYRRTSVQVTFANNGEPVPANVYAWSDDAAVSKGSLYGTWSYKDDFLPRLDETLAMWRIT
jgi:gamma-glutamylcyclotransferase (GGCT)/AIG2-like uncharacterized protein YtfP